MIDFRIIPEHRLMVVCHWGSPSTADVQNMRQAYRTDPDYSIRFDAYVDFSRLDKDYDVEDLQKLSKRFLIHPQIIKVAIFATDDSLHEMVRRFKDMTEEKKDSDLRVFRSSTEALEWLGREDVDITSICKDIIAKGRFGTR